MSLVEPTRRTTITTYDIDSSLSFYCDLLGMKVWYDGVFDDPSVQKVYNLPQTVQTRVCILKASLDIGGLVSGMIGLMHFEGMEPPNIPEPVKRPLPGEVIIMFGTTQLREIERKLRENRFFYEGPINLSTPGRSIVYELLTRDPNGVRLAFAQQSAID
jgi:catechol 2,3-dioxygenase-like lactoylglutathione lyase family enzyme